MPVHDFFKPRREVDTRTVVENVLDVARESGERIRSNLAEKILKYLPRSNKKNAVLFENEKLMIHTNSQIDVIPNR